MTGSHTPRPGSAPPCEPALAGGPLEPGSTKPLKTVLYTCPFVPAEWIAAHGLSPRRMAPEPGSSARREGAVMGVCGYAQAFLETARDTPAAGVVFTTACDQMRRAADAFAAGSASPKGPPAFLLNVPSSWRTPVARQLYRAEVERLGRFLVRLGGVPPSMRELSDILRQSELARESLLARRPLLTSRRFAEALSRFQAGERADRDTAPPPSTTSGSGQDVALALLGCPLMPSHFGLLDLLEAGGARVVLDATGGGERALPGRFATPAIDEDPFEALIDAYFGIPDVFQRPNSRLYDWLGERVNERRVRGLVVWHYAWCDLWRAEIMQLRECLRLPLLDLDAGDGGELNARSLNRVKAFLETITQSDARK